jgi:glutathione S-transferase
MNHFETNALIRLHGINPYDRSAKARWLLTELKLDFEDRWHDQEKREFERPEFLKLNPMGRIPCLEIGDTVIYESGAICAYLADRYLERGLAPGVTAQERADYQKWMYFAATTLDSFVSRIMIIEDIPAGDCQMKKLTELQDEFRDCMVALDRTLSHASFLVRNKFSAADICVSYQLYFTTLWPELGGILEEFPSVASYLKRMKEMPSAVEAKVFSYQA